MDRREFISQSAILGSAAVVGGINPNDIGARVNAAGIQRGAGMRAAIVLRRARIYDGSGGAPFTGDVAISGGRIVEIGAKLATRGDEEVDLHGLALAPGFIDSHSHTGEGLVRDPTAASKVRQGVTTEVAGQDGSSIQREDASAAGAPFTDVPTFLSWLDANGAAVNVASMIGTGTMRGQTVGNADRRATADEISRMTALVQAALAGGACGVSSGLEYTPGGYADAAELEQIVTPLRGTGLPFASHMRNEDDRLLAAMEEIIGIGQRAGVAAHISHLKAQGERNWWKMNDALRLIDDARSTGIDVTFDIYPYIAYSTGIMNLFPLWSREGGSDAFITRLNDPADAARIEGAARDKIAMLGTWNAVQFTSGGADAFTWIVGRRMGDLAMERKTEPYALLLEIVRGTRGRPSMVGFGMSEENVARGIAHSASMICSDAGAATMGSGSPHPRAYGTYPRVLGRFVRELKAVKLETAIRKMTALPAARLRFTDRGRIAKDLVGDLVAFDPATVSDNATFEQPHQYPIGIPHVIVNGVFVVRGGEHTGARPGRAVRPTR
ncbi:MAG: D-aminoacylase [Longimicrobiales bacterium]